MAVMHQKIIFPHPDCGKNFLLDLRPGLKKWRALASGLFAEFSTVCYYFILTYFCRHFKI